MLQFRREVQRVDPVPRFSSLSVLERRSSTNRCAYDGSSYPSLRVMKGATGEFHKCGTTESMTVRHDHDGPSRDPSTQSVFITNDSTARNDKTSRYSFKNTKMTFKKFTPILLLLRL